MSGNPTRRYKTVLLFGAPGAGKGTQGKILGKVPGFYHLACGDVFRSLDMASDLGRKFMEYSSRGELVPDELTIEMWRQNMHAQTVLSIYKPNVDLLVLHLICPNEDEMVRRMRRRALKENRIDDADEKVIRRRFEVYDHETRPVLDYYPRSIVREVNAMGSPAEVLQHVLEVIVPIQNEHFRNPLS